MTLRLGKVAEIGQGSGSARDKLLAAIARSAEELTTGKGWPEGVIDLMEDLGRITGVSRVWIFQTIEAAPDYVIQDYPFEWADCPEHVQLDFPRFNMFRTNIEEDTYRAMVESRKRGEWQSLITSSLPFGSVRSDQENQGILSMLTIPIMVEGQWWGTLGFDDCRREYAWSDVEIALLRTASYLISGAVIRDRLSAKTRQFSILQSLTESSTWECDLQSGHFRCGRELLKGVAGLSENIHMSVREVLHLVHPDDRRSLLQAFRLRLRAPSGAFRQDIRIADACGAYVWVEIIGSLRLDGRGRPETFAGIAVEILKRKQEEEHLRIQAGRDHLTGVGNRGAFDRAFSRLHSLSVNNDREYALLLADMDDFKRVNDTYGHDAGDAVLKHFVSICRRSLRCSDNLMRVGGEEFAILLPNADERAAQIIGERILEELYATPIAYEDIRIRITASIGCAAFPNRVDIDSPRQLFKLADLALYTAKRGGKNSLKAACDLEMECPLEAFVPASPAQPS